ncbi:DUF1707 SHOCT-like domain-containing protein [Nocardia arizonensis]|uniref:DUF1707 SHOCT-like domain-containing protein n=1 Tax=Nocardia arizonensis TaxID=1141647 RepID=UPI000AD0178B|nr:DUF1707 domain-containing protein [Nocardia arizonensis]
MSTTASGRMRARDLDRANVSAVLDAAYAEGQLGADEYHDRTAKADTAKTLGELDGLISDLQSPTAVKDLTGQRAARTRNPLNRRRFSGGYPDHTRARDTDRAETVRALDAARADGQLTEDEHRALTELAAEARTIGDLAELVSDLQRRADAAPPPRPPRSHRRQFFAAVVVAIAVLATTGTYALTGPDDAEPARASAPTADLSVVEPLVIATPKLTTAEGMTVFRERYRAKFGDTLVDELRAFDTYASLKRIAPDGAQWSVGYDYRGGFQRASGPALSTRRSDTVAFDLATADFAAIAAVAANAPALTKVPEGTVSSFSFEVSDFGSQKGVPTVEITVRNERQQYGEVLLAPTGEVLKVTEVRP